jgi:hypothetical protein
MFRKFHSPAMLRAFFLPVVVIMRKALVFI